MSTVEINEEVIRRYIEHQSIEDSGQAKLEFERLVKSPGCEAEDIWFIPGLLQTDAGKWYNPFAIQQ